MKPFAFTVAGLLILAGPALADVPIPPADTAGLSLDLVMRKNLFFNETFGHVPPNYYAPAPVPTPGPGPEYNPPRQTNLLPDNRMGSGIAEKPGSVQPGSAAGGGAW